MILGKMKINDYKVGTTFEITCAKHKHLKTDEIVYDSFGIKKEFAYMWARKPEDIIKVKATIIEEDIVIKDLLNNPEYDENCIDYFGFIDGFEKNDLNISIIWRNIKLYEICFTYGADAERFFNHDQLDDDFKTYLWHKGDRRGMTVRLKIEEI